MFHDNAGHEDLTEKIIGCGIAVHEGVGPGLFEAVYELCLARELELAGLEFVVRPRIPLTYRGVVLDAAFVPDLIVDGKVILEVKAVDRMAPVFQAQLVTYLKLSGCPVGLLMNFNVPFLRQGIRRLARPDLYVRREPPFTKPVEAEARAEDCSSPGDASSSGSTR